MKTFILIKKGRSKKVKDVEIGEHDKGERKKVDKEERKRFDLSLSTYNNKNSVVSSPIFDFFILIIIVYMSVNCRCWLLYITYTCCYRWLLCCLLILAVVLVQHTVCGFRLLSKVCWYFLVAVEYCLLILSVVQYTLVQYTLLCVTGWRKLSVDTDFSYRYTVCWYSCTSTLPVNISCCIPSVDTGCCTERWYCLLLLGWCLMSVATGCCRLPVDTGCFIPSVDAAFCTENWLCLLSLAGVYCLLLLAAVDCLLILVVLSPLLILAAVQNMILSINTVCDTGGFILFVYTDCHIVSVDTGHFILSVDTSCMLRTVWWYILFYDYIVCRVLYRDACFFMLSHITF